MAIHSMTAFGSAEVAATEFNYRCEIKTLNSRFVDVNVRIPRFVSSLEHDIVKEVKATIPRGKVDVTFEITASQSASRLPQLNSEAAKHYIELTKQLGKIASFESRHLTHYELLKMEGVLEAQSKENIDDIINKHRENVINCLQNGLAKVTEARAVEGKALDQVLRDLLKELQESRKIVESQASDVQQEIYANYRKRLENLLKNLGEAGQQVSSVLPEERLLNEIAILTDKSDIAEELARLAAHEKEFLVTLKEGSQIGRKLDFLCQEMHREVNTMSNKLTHTQVAKQTLSMKQAIERMRQQVQNIE